jgi:hypothetical protein
LLMVYPTTKLEISDNKAPPCFKAFWIENVSHKHLSTQNLQSVSFKRTLISLTGFTSTPIPLQRCTFLPSSWHYKQLMFSQFYPCIWQNTLL